MKRILIFFQENAFARNSAVLFLGTMVMNVLNYLFHLVLGRVATPTEYGEIESLISLLVIISVPAATIGLIATKFGAAAKAEGSARKAERLFSYLTGIVLRYGVIVFIVALAITPLVRDFLKLESSIPIIFLWIVMFLTFLSSVATGLLGGWQFFSTVNAVGIWSTAMKFIVCIGLVTMGFGVSGMTGGLVFAGVVGYGIASLSLRKRGILGLGDASSSDILEAIDFSSIKKYAFPVFFGTLSITILGNMDMVFAKHVLAPGISGEYGALAVAAKTIFFVTGVIATVLFAMSAEESHKKRQSDRTFHLALGATVAVSFGSVIFFALFPKFIVGLLFGAKYVHTAPLLKWFALAAAGYSIANLFLQYLLSLHKTAVTYAFSALAGLYLVALFFFGKSLYAIITVTILAQAVAVAVGIFYYFRKRRHA